MSAPEGEKKEETTKDEIMVLQISQYIGNKTYTLVMQCPRQHVNEEKIWGENLLNSWIPKPATPAEGEKPGLAAPSPAPVGKVTMDSISQALGDLTQVMAITDKGGFYEIKPKQFLGSENFATVASAIRGLGGEYISAGKASHFRIFKR